MSTKTAWIIAGISALCIGTMTLYTWNIQTENQRLVLVNSIYNAEHRILKEELADLLAKPTYEQGYKTALIRVGGPQNPGAYQDGWDDAAKIFNNKNSYADGYHAAVEQFGYTKTTAMNRWLVPESNIAKTTPVKLDE